MIEPLPETVKERVVEHLREYLLEVEDDLKWDNLLKRTQTPLTAAARRAREKVAQGQSRPLDADEL